MRINVTLEFTSPTQASACIAFSEFLAEARDDRWSPDHDNLLVALGLAMELFVDCGLPAEYLGVDEYEGQLKELAEMFRRSANAIDSSVQEWNKRPKS